MTKRWFVLLLAAFLAGSTGATAKKMQNDSVVRATIDRLDGFLSPYRQKSLREGREGRVAPFDLPVSPDDWRSAAVVRQSGFVRDIRFLLSAGVCTRDAAALKKIYDIDWLVYGLGFDETEALFLERHAQSMKLDLPFHQRYRRVRRYSRDTSEAPQRTLGLTIAFDEQRYADALVFVPGFRRLC